MKRPLKSPLDQKLDARRAGREARRQVALMGETLAAFRARETAKPPTLSEIFARNRADTTVCPATGDLFATAGKLPREAVKVLRRRCGIGAWK